MNGEMNNKMDKVVESISNVSEVSEIKEMTVLGNEYGGSEEGSDFIHVGVLLNSALRPRIVGKGGKRNWGETFQRLSQVYDLLLSYADIGGVEELGGGLFSAIVHPNSPLFDLVDEFYRLFPEAREGEVEEGIPKRALRPNLLLVNDDRLRAFFKEHLREAFGNLIEGTRFGFKLEENLPLLFPRTSEEEDTSRGARGRRKSKNPNFVRLQEAISLAARSLEGGLPEEAYEKILREVMEAYLNYAGSLRHLPKPEV